MPKALVLDANILVRASLGRRVLDILERYRDRAHFMTPASSYVEVREHLPEILVRRGLSPGDAAALIDDALGRLPALVASVPTVIFAHNESEARRRLTGRDEEDWPLVALAMVLGCPIWTEDQDLFGSGIATWTTDPWRFTSTTRTNPYDSVPTADL